MKDVHDVNLSWMAIKAERREVKNERLDNFDSTGWTRHNDVHYSRIINGSKLDYWPTTTRYRYKGKTYFSGKCDVYKFIVDQIK